MIACIAPPGVVFGHTATVEKAPWARTNADALVLCALFNSFPFDWLVRQKAATHLSLYLLEALPVPRFSEAACRFLAHAALLLSCNHAGYAATLARTGRWQSRLETVRIHYVPRSMRRWRHAYGLSRDQYDHVLRGFSHRSHPDAPSLCLAAFDDLKGAWGCQRFWQRHDRLAGVPIVTVRAEPSA